MILALAGGVGGAKLVDGLARLLPAPDLVTVVNTGDDFEHLGLHIAPDLDTVMYTLAARANPATGWGLADETWHFMAALERVGGETWFRLGDQDLATHIRRTQLLAGGATLSELTATLCRAFGVATRLVPMSDDRVRTRVRTEEGELDFQDYFVRQRCAPAVRGIRYAGAEDARPAPGFLRALDDARLRAIVFCPSNPWLSIEPMLALPGVRQRLRRARVPVIAVSPIVAGQAIKGPAAKIMRELGCPPGSDPARWNPGAFEVARRYGELLDGFVLDHADAALADAVAGLGLTPLVTATVMTGEAQRTQLAREVLAFATYLRAQLRR